MSSFDPMAAAVDWLDAYRAATLSIVDLYAPDAVLECGCNGQATVIGRSGLFEYWRQRFDDKPAGQLQGLPPRPSFQSLPITGDETGSYRLTPHKAQMAGDMVVESYEVPGGIVQATLKFNDAGQIVVRSQCGPV